MVILVVGLEPPLGVVPNSILPGTLLLEKLPSAVTTICAPTFAKSVPSEPINLIFPSSSPL